jgi:hypothetical protein
MILSGDVDRVGKSSAAEVLTVTVLVRADLANGERAGMIPVVLVQDSALLPSASDPDDAMIQQSRSTVRATVVDQKRNLQRPHTVADAALDVVFLQPVPACPGIAVVNANALPTRAGLFEGLDDGIGRSGVVIDAADLSIVDGAASAGPINGSSVCENDTGLRACSMHGMVLLWLGHTWQGATMTYPARPVRSRSPTCDSDKLDERCRRWRFIELAMPTTWCR